MSLFALLQHNLRVLDIASTGADKRSEEQRDLEARHEAWIDQALEFNALDEFDRWWDSEPRDAEYRDARS